MIYFCDDVTFVITSVKLFRKFCEIIKTLDISMEYTEFFDYYVKYKINIGRNTRPILFNISILYSY